MVPRTTPYVVVRFDKNILAKGVWEDIWAVSYERRTNTCKNT